MAVAGATPRLHRTRAPPFPAPSPDPFPPPRATQPSQLPAEIQVSDPADPFSGSGSLPRALPRRTALGARVPRPGGAVKGGRRRAPRVLPAPEPHAAPPRARTPAPLVRPRLGSSLPGPCSAPAALLMVPLHSRAHKSPSAARRSDSGDTGLRGEEGGLNEPALGPGRPLGGKWLSAKTRDSGRGPSGRLLGWRAGGRGAPGVGTRVPGAPGVCWTQGSGTRQPVLLPPSTRVLYNVYFCMLGIS